MAQYRSMALLRYVTLALLPGFLFAALTPDQRASIDQSTGGKGVYTEAEDTHKVTFPRTDVKVTVEGRAMSPFLGFSSWAAFTPSGHGGVMVMGDIVLQEDEVNPAVSAALDSGLEVTALHNHFFYESPRVLYMHIGGMGSVETLAPAVKKVLDAVKAVRAGSPSVATKFAGEPVGDKNSITAPVLDGILNVKGETNNGMYKATIGRTANMHGSKVSKQMGVNTWAAFAGTDEYSLVDGDFAMTKDELQPVLKSLRRAGINIVAIHNHMTNEDPQYVFLHYWGKGPAASLAKGIRAALDTQKPVASVLFVCEHGAVKSVLAAAEFNRQAERRGLSWRATFRGTQPESEIAPAVVKVLKQDGIVLEAKPSKISRADLEAATEVVTMGCKLPPDSVERTLREWNDVPAFSSNPEASRQDINRRVSQLLDELTRQSK